MNTSILKTRIIGLLCFFTFLSITLQASNLNTPNYSEYAKRVENLNTIIDLRVTDDVTRHIEMFVTKRRKESELVLGRTSLYFPLIENLIREKNLPEELKYIAVIESGLKPTAVSKRGATGLWQFMKGTALLFGLTINHTVDERKDIYKSTDKALDYLQLLFEKYGDWTVALAAYNCGPGNVSKAIRRAGGETNYWKIRKYLPKETQDYIPKFIATSYLMNYYFMHDLTPLTQDDEIKLISTVRVFQKVNFADISQELEIHPDIVKALNPMYIQGFIPANEKDEFYLTLPESKMYHFIDKYSSTEHLVFVPENLFHEGSNLNKGKVTRENIVAFVSGLNEQTHEVRDNFKRQTIYGQLKKEMVFSNPTSRFHKLGRKESLADVAFANNISLAEIMRLNNLQVDAALPAGSIIRI